jgi:amino acid transporter
MQTLSPAPNEHTIQGKLMRKATIGLLVLGVVVLIAWNWLWLWAPEWLFDLVSQQTASPVAAVLSMREWVQIIIGVVLLIASLFVVLSPKYGTKDTVLGATKDNRSTRSTLQERHAAQDQGPHDALTKFRFPNH